VIFRQIGAPAGPPLGEHGGEHGGGEHGDTQLGIGAESFYQGLCRIRLAPGRVLVYTVDNSFTNLLEPESCAMARLARGDFVRPD
jgi:hypothetical protein